MSTYAVYVDDNFHYMDEDERYKLGDFEDCQSAIAACKRIVDGFITRKDLPCSADELYEHYLAFGEDPWIRTDDPSCTFSARIYAQERCRGLASQSGS